MLKIEKKYNNPCYCHAAAVDAFLKCVCVYACVCVWFVCHDIVSCMYIMHTSHDKYAIPWVNIYGPH